MTVTPFIMFYYNVLHSCSFSLYLSLSPDWKDTDKYLLMLAASLLSHVYFVCVFILRGFWFLVLFYFILFLPHICYFEMIYYVPA